MLPNNEIALTISSPNINNIFLNIPLLSISPLRAEFKRLVKSISGKTSSVYSSPSFITDDKFSASI